MAKAIDVAKLMIKKNIDTERNTYDGNMKLQKVLCFANIISLAEYDKPLFNDDMYAFRNGFVVENVRLRYKNDFQTLLEDSRQFSPEFSDEEYDAINIACGVFGDASAKELSKLSHTFKFWQDSFERSPENNIPNKSQAIISLDDVRKELDSTKDVIRVYRNSCKSNDKLEVINGIKFSISPELTLDDTLLNKLEEFSLIADEEAYCVFMDEGELMIY